MNIKKIEIERKINKIKDKNKELLFELEKKKVLFLKEIEFRNNRIGKWFYNINEFYRKYA